MEKLKLNLIFEDYPDNNITLVKSKTCAIPGKKIKDLFEKVEMSWLDDDEGKGIGLDDYQYQIILAQNARELKSEKINWRLNIEELQLYKIKKYLKDLPLNLIITPACGNTDTFLDILLNCELIITFFKVIKYILYIFLIKNISYKHITEYSGFSKEFIVGTIKCFNNWKQGFLYIDKEKHSKLFEFIIMKNLKYKLNKKTKIWEQKDK